MNQLVSFCHIVSLHVALSGIFMPVSVLPLSVFRLTLINKWHKINVCHLVSIYHLVS